MNVTNFINRNFLHFNAAVLRDAAIEYERQLALRNKMMITLAGAMSTAEIGKTLATMIRSDKVHAICCTGANLEEDVFNLIAHKEYKRIPEWRDLTPAQEFDLLNQGMNRVTDTCIPEKKAMKLLEKKVSWLWRNSEIPRFPHEYLYQLLLFDQLADDYQINPKDSWVMAAAEKNLPLFVPGWEDSTLGNIFAADVMLGKQSRSVMLGGIDYMIELKKWYEKQDGVGFFQIGGGIAGDFPICVVPLIEQDMEEPCFKWTYFCQISDATTSYGGYSGATPNEKITWGKLDVDTPKFMIESDATIVAPLIFAHILGW